MNNTSPINTVLLVLVLLAIVGGGVWWYTTYGPGAPAEEEDAGIEINLGGSADNVDSE